MYKLINIFLITLLLISFSCSKDSEIENPNKNEGIENTESKLAEQTAILLAAYNDNALIETIDSKGNSYSIVFTNGSKAEISPLNKVSADYVFVKSVEITDMDVRFNLNDGRELLMGLKYGISVEFDSEDLGVMGPNETREVHYTIKSNTNEINIEISPTKGIKGEVVAGDSKLNGIIKLTTDGTISEESYVTVLISNEKKVINKKIQFEGAGLKVYDNSTKRISSEGGTVKLEFLTNVNCRVMIGEEYQDWVKDSPESRAMEYDFRNVEISPNYGGERKAIVKIEGIDGELSIEYTIIQEADLTEIAKLQREALIALYKATDGDNWFINTNWCSDKPIWEWYGVNYNYWNGEPEKTDIVVSLFLGGNNLRGEIPEEFGCLLDYMSTVDRNLQDNFNFSLSGNGLYGKIPETVLNHPRWPELGWGVISQNSFLGGILEIDNYKLKISDRYLFEFKDGVDSETNLYSILKRNNYTLIYYISGAQDGCLSTIDFTKATTNLHLDFHNKGLNTVFSITGLNESIFEWMELSVPEDAPEDIIYINDYDPYEPGLGSMALFDSEGNLIYTLSRDYAIDQEWYVEKVKAKLISILGQPEDHPEFEMEDFYTSTDYSKDGEVFTLQKATTGKGIDLVFLGDAYVDRDMDAGGKYEQEMREGMEKLFSIEPYKSLRERFNVYSVKVVSKSNLYYIKGSEPTINWNDETCFKYASKIPGIDKERMMISVIFGSPGFFRDETAMYSDGSFVAYMSKGITDALIHETGGHGIAKLYDEYVEPGYEAATLDEEGKNYLDRVWKEWGFGANVDWRNDPETVKWSHLLKDARYAGENLGIYEGGYLHAFGAYRPTENSMMRYNNYPFNAPSREQIYKAVMTLSEGVDWVYNYEDFVKFDEPGRKEWSSYSLYNTRGPLQSKSEWKNHKSPIIKKGTWREATSSLKFREKNR